MKASAQNLKNAFSTATAAVEKRAAKKERTQTLNIHTRKTGRALRFSISLLMTASLMASRKALKIDSAAAKSISAVSADLMYFVSDETMTAAVGREQKYKRFCNFSTHTVPNTVSKICFF